MKFNWWYRDFQCCDNILIMCPNHDSLFDKHLISFESDGKILINKRIDNINKTMLNINSDMKLGIEISENLKQFLGYHRNIFENKNT
ncbi:HNH endonuclease [Treponema sp.]|uniref:HNH endonuclease n=1 Tax=Treponema sp. TaxID=166 RepID=UPI003FD6F812